MRWDRRYDWPACRDEEDEDGRGGGGGWRKRVEGREGRASGENGDGGIVEDIDATYSLFCSFLPSFLFPLSPFFFFFFPARQFFRESIGGFCGF